MDLKNSKFLWYGVATLIFVSLIYFADFEKFLSALTSVDPLMMFIALIFGLTYFIFFGSIWHLFLRKMNVNVDFLKSMKLVMSGIFMNSVTPLGPMGGEPFMAYVVSDNTDSSYEKAISCIVSADMVNTIPFITFSTIGVAYFFLFRPVNQFIINLGIFTFAFLIFGALLAYFLWFEEEKLEKMSYKFLDWIKAKLGKDKLIEKLKEKFKEIKEVFETVGDDPRHLLKTTSIAHLAVIGQFISLYFIMIGMGVEPTFPSIYFPVVLSGLATISPTPGGSGTFEGAFTGILILFDVVPSTALAIAVLFRMTTFWPGIVIGYLTLMDLKTKK